MIPVNFIFCFTLMACLTAAATSPGLDFQVPSPTWGMLAPEGSLDDGHLLAAMLCHMEIRLY